MSTSATILEDGSTLSRIDRSLFRLESFLALLSGLAVFSLMLFAVVSVGGRNFFNSPLRGYVDWIEQAMPLIAFLGLAYCQRLGAHIRMDIVIRMLRGRALWGFETVTVLLMLLLCLALTWGTWAHFDRSFDWAAPLWSRDSSVDIRLPLWPTKLLAPVCFAVLSLRLAIQLWGYAQAFITDAERPVAVPRPEDPAAVAEHEAESVSGADTVERD
ncbi:TRAP transporter small permease [Bauldia sp.]|uniref:TRAP transporter small permease n=1 Tax=Bauldia sp. TaxID=2575872 RepID=UPI003BAB6737